MTQGAILPPVGVPAALPSAPTGPAAQRVPVRLKSGAVGTMPITELDDPSIERALSPAEFREHLETEQKSHSVAHNWIASAEGVARGFTGGQSDIAAKGLAGTIFGDEAERETARHLREEEAAHPITAGLGEASGFIGGMFLGGPEEAAAGKLATAEKVAPELNAGVEAIRGEGSTSGLLKALHLVGEAPNAGASASKLIEQQTAKLLGGSAAAKIAGTTLGGAAEGGLYSAESQLDEQVLGDQDLNGEKIASAAGYGALMGGALAGGTATFGTLAKKGLVASSPALEKMAGEQAFRAAGPTLATAREAERAGGAAAIGRTMIERDVIPTEGSALERALTPDELVPRNKAALNQIGKEISEITQASGARVPMADVMEAMNKQIDRLEATAATKGMARSVREFQEDFLSQVAGDVMSTPKGEVASIPIQTLIRERRGLGDLAFKEAKALDPKMRVEALRNVYGAWSDLETSALDKASADIGGVEGQKLRALNKEYQQLKIVAAALDRSSAASIRNRAISPSDYLTGAAVGIADAHSGGIASALTGGFSALAHKFIRERGNSLAASYLDRLAQLGAIRKVVAGVDNDTQKAVSAFMNGKRAGEHETLSLPPYRGGKLQRRFQEAIDDANEPPKSVDFTHALGIGRAVRSTLMRTTAFLQSKIPEPTVDRFSLTPQLEKKQYTPQDMQSFLRYYEAARHPGLLAHELAQGKVHPETVEAVQTVAPKLFAELQQKVMEAARDLKSPLSYDQKIQLGVLFGAPTHWSLDPTFLYAFQQTKAPPPPAQKPNGPQPRGKQGAKFNSSVYATTTEAVQSGKLHGGR